MPTQDNMWIFQTYVIGTFLTTHPFYLDGIKLRPLFQLGIVGWCLS